MERFVVKHYTEDERPTIKGNGFDGLEVGTDRDEAEQFIDWVNKRLALLEQAEAFIAKAFEAHPNLDMDIEARGRDA